MSGSIVRPLPARPDLESEKKRAKHLLREAQHGDPIAVARVRQQNRSLAETQPEPMKLADAQLAIAREYGFRSWPLLVRYYETFERHERSYIARNRGESRQAYEGREPLTLLAEHREKRFWAATLIGAFVPRFYGLKAAEIFAQDVTEAEARPVIAREQGFGSWDALIAQADSEKHDQWREAESPERQMTDAMRNGDLVALRRVVEGHPEVLRITERGGVPAIGMIAATTYLRNDSQESKAILDYVTGLGIDVRECLNRPLLGALGGGMTAERVRRLIDAGADPAWVAPNGYTVLEHAIQRYWNGDAVDELARHVTPRATLFVAAGLGDVASMHRYFDRKGKLTAKAQRERPDMMALSGVATPSMADTDDHLELWDYAFAAAVNGRGAAFDFLLARGFPIDANPGMTLLSFAIGNALVPMVELLLSRGASLDVRGSRPSMTGREVAASYLANRRDADGRRVLELCGLEPERVYADHAAERGSPTPSAGLSKILDFARRDAARRQQSAVGVENYFIGTLASDWAGPELRAIADAGVDMQALRLKYRDRLEMPERTPDGKDLPFDPQLSAAIGHGTDIALAKGDVIVTWPVLIHTLENGPVGAIVRELGGDVQLVIKTLQRYLN